MRFNFEERRTLVEFLMGHCRKEGTYLRCDAVDGLLKAIKFTEEEKKKLDADIKEEGQRLIYFVYERELLPEIEVEVTPQQSTIIIEKIDELERMKKFTIDMVPVYRKFKPATDEKNQ